MSVQKDGNGNLMIKPKMTTFRGTYERRETSAKVLTHPVVRKMRTKEEIQDLYQNSVLCTSTRQAKENGAWYNSDYTAGREEDINFIGENYVYEQCEEKLLK